MPDSLIPEQLLQVSPSLAATIGLEQALLLQHLDNCIRLSANTSTKAELDPQYLWTQSSLAQLRGQLPFWEPAAIRRIIQDLAGLGMILLKDFPVEMDQTFHLAINQAIGNSSSQITAGSNRQERESNLGAYRIPADWTPNHAALQQLGDMGIENSFIEKALNDFVFYWRERNEVSHAWSSKFLQYVSRLWEREQQKQAAKTIRANTQAAEIKKAWQPSTDALEILQQMGIHQNFIVDAIPEFVLYWRERGSEQNTWNSKFVSHVKRQWASYTHTLKHDTEPRPIAEDWHPDGEVFDILALANIDADFAQSLLPEFVMYWRDRNELHHSWNTRFLQFVKKQWSNNYYTQEKGGSGNPGQTTATRKTRDRSIVEDLTDRSWAS